MDPLNIKPALTGKLSREEWHNVLDEKLHMFKEHLAAFPGPQDPLNGSKYIVWERRSMIWTGRIAEGVAIYQMGDLVSPEKGAMLFSRAKNILNQATSKIIMGNRQ